MRKLINIVVENRSEDDWEDDWDDDSESKYDSLPSSSAIKSHLLEICSAAQTVYDRWDQSDPYEDELNGGGICHLIADEIANILCSAGMNVITQSSSHEQHVYCVGQFSDGIFEIDIRHWLYERGAGFTWHKLPGVVFDPTYIHVGRLDGDPSNMGQYVDEWEDDF